MDRVATGVGKLTIRISPNSLLLLLIDFWTRSIGLLAFASARGICAWRDNGGHGRSIRSGRGRVRLKEIFREGRGVVIRRRPVTTFRGCRSVRMLNMTTTLLDRHRLTVRSERLATSTDPPNLAGFHPETARPVASPHRSHPSPAYSPSSHSLIPWVSHLVPCSVASL